MIAEAVDTLVTLGWALAAWIAVLAAVAAVVLLAGAALGAWAAGVVWRRVVRPSWARGRLRARIYTARRLRRPCGRTRPRWSHSQPLDYEEAA